MHFFWIFGRPEVYVLNPSCAFGFASRNYPRVFTQGYVWLPRDGSGYNCHRIHRHERLGPPHVHSGHERRREYLLRALSMAIAVPTGIKIFNWMATMWGGKIRFDVPMMFASAFSISVSSGWINGSHVGCGSVRLATRKLLLRGGSPLSLCNCGWHSLYRLPGGAFYYWFPKVYGKMLNETLGMLHFWLFFIGSTLRSISYIFPDCWGCPGGSIPTNPAAVGHGI